MLTLLISQPAFLIQAQTMKRLSPDREADLGVLAKRLQKHISPKEVRSLIASGKATLFVDLSASNTDTDYYLLDDNRFMIAMKFGQQGVIYPSKEAFDDLMDKGAKQSKRIFGSSNRLTNIEAIKVSASAFKALIDQAPRQLSELLGIKEEKLDYSASSLKLLSKELNKYNRETIYHELVSQLVAYCGELMRRSISGSWNISADRDDTLSAVTVYSDNDTKYTYDPCKLIVGIVFEPGRSINLKSEIDAELGKYGLMTR